MTSEMEKRLAFVEQFMPSTNPHITIPSSGTSQEIALYEKMRKIAIENAEAVHYNGAGFIADQNLRSWVKEYNMRNFEDGLGSMPLSFNHLEPFIIYNPKYSYFSIRNEIDYLISGGDFYKFLVNEDKSTFNVREAIKIKENQIHHFTAYDDVYDNLIATKEGSFGLCSVSFIRHKNELSIAVCAGKLTSDQEVDQTNQFYKNDFGGNKRVLSPINAPGLWSHHIFMRVNIENEEILSIAALREFTNSFEYLAMCDPFAKGCGESNLELAKATDRINPALMELAKTSVYLPSFLNSKFVSIKEENRKTKFGRSAKHKNRRSRILLDEKIRIKKIASVKYINPNSNTTREKSYTSPSFKVNVSGFWRRLKEDQEGKDQNGNPIKGKTWVNPHQRYKENPDREMTEVTEQEYKQYEGKVVYLKSRFPKNMHYSNDKLNVIYDVNRKVATKSRDIVIPTTDSESGYVYVMVNPALKQSMYKVGFTRKDPELRARELSSSTGVPQSYIVLDSWSTDQPEYIESIIHKNLAEYRVNDHREFFSLP